MARKPPQYQSGNPHRTAEARRPAQALSRPEARARHAAALPAKQGQRHLGAEGSDGHGKYWTKAFAEADDFDESNGETILTFFEAQDAAKKLARGGADGSADSAPITVDGALTDYRRDLIARDADPYNADWPRVHLTARCCASRSRC